MIFDFFCQQKIFHVRSPDSGQRWQLICFKYHISVWNHVSQIGFGACDKSMVYFSEFKIGRRFLFSIIANDIMFFISINFFFVKATSIFQSVHNYGMRRTGSGYMVHTYYCVNISGKSLFFSWLLLFFVKKTTLGKQQKSVEKKSPVIINKAKQVVM